MTADVENLYETWITIANSSELFMSGELAVGSGAVNISEPRESLLFDCVVEPSPKDSE